MNKLKHHIVSKGFNLSSSYLLQWVKASLLILIAPLMILAIYDIYGRLSFVDTLIGASFAFIFSLFFIRPYLSDLSALTHYVEQLAQDNTAKAPSLSFLSNVEKLSSTVNELHNSWEERRHLLEESLIESKMIFDILPDIVIILDDELRILRANSAAHNAFEMLPEVTHIQELLPDPAVLSFIKWVMHDKKGKDLELAMPAHSRNYIVHIENFPVYSPGGISVIMVLHDITESKSTEKLFADFVANASHEIRTPLASIVGFIETLQTSAKDDPVARDKFLQIMADQSSRMAMLVSDLLSLSKIEMKSNTPPTERVEIVSIIKEIISQLEWPASERNIVLSLNIEEADTVITGDSTELMQLFTNLIQNAIKYGYESSVVTVTVRCSPVPIALPELKGAGKVLAIEIQDQGEGIDKEHLPRLTERFYRVDGARSRTHKVGGTGLGLSIVKQIIKRHQGGMTITSVTGVGSCFTVYFPV